MYSKCILLLLVWNVGSPIHTKENIDSVQKVERERKYWANSWIGSVCVSRRSKLEIYLDVLWVIKNGTKKPTRIMYEANLSWKPLQQILKSMITKGFISEVDAMSLKDNRTRSFYEMTHKGENIINYFNRGKEYLMIGEGSKVRIWMPLLIHLVHAYP